MRTFLEWIFRGLLLLVRRLLANEPRNVYENIVFDAIWKMASLSGGRVIYT